MSAVLEIEKKEALRNVEKKEVKAKIRRLRSLLDKDKKTMHSVRFLFV